MVRHSTLVQAMCAWLRPLFQLFEFSSSIGGYLPMDEQWHWQSGTWNEFEGKCLTEKFKKQMPSRTLIRTSSKGIFSRFLRKGAQCGVQQQCQRILAGIARLHWRLCHCQRPCHDADGMTAGPATPLTRS